MSNLIYVVPVLGLIGLLVMAVKFKWVNAQDAGDDKMKGLANHIREGALAFLSADEDRWLNYHAIIGYAILILLFFRIVWGFKEPKKTV